jgi:integrase
MGPSGKLKGTKTGAERSLPILAPVAQDLKKMKRGGPDDLVVVLGTDWDSWTEDTFRPARARVGVAKPPYSLRHTFASLMIAEGRTIQEVAALLGHSTTDLTHRTYGHLFAEAQLSEGQDAEAAAVAARKRAPARRRARQREASERSASSSRSTTEKSSSR